MNMGYHSNLQDICKIMAVFIFVLYVLQFFTNDEKSWVCLNYAVILHCVEILFFARSLPCLKIYVVNT